MKLYLLLFVVIFAACAKDPIEPLDLPIAGIRYFPLEAGAYIDYTITEITIDKTSNYYDTVVYSLRQRTDAQIIDNENDTAWRIEMWRAMPNAAYQIHDIWMAKKTDSQVQMVEENIRYVKIRFPANIDKTWDGNIYNENDNQNYTITGIDQPKTINGFTFDSILTVTQEADSSIIHKDLCSEQYAIGIGLVYKEMIHINSQEPQPDI